jgi:hypothetical protein
MMRLVAVRPSDKSEDCCAVELPTASNSVLQRKDICRKRRNTVQGILRLVSSMRGFDSNCGNWLKLWYLH